MQRGSVAAVYRTIPYEIKGFKELGLPPVVAQICEKPRGLVLVTGPTGSGKSTTLAAMLDKVNKERHEHIITIEDPIEYLHNHQKCLVNQREVHSDTHSFTNSLRAALREDPDVVLIGEMRDLETIEAALRIAETGHLDVRHASYELGGADHQPYRRRVPVASAVPDSCSAFVRARRHHVPVAPAESERLGSCARDGDSRSELGHPEPHSRRQDPSDLLLDADRTGQARDADVQPVARDALFQENRFTLQLALAMSSNADELQDMINRGTGLTTPQGGGRPPVAAGGRPGGMVRR